jgi:Ca-activated chloride channel homolog
MLFFGKGNIGSMFQVPKWNLLGGLLGALYVGMAVLSVPKLGVGTTIVTAIVGQIAISMVLDHFGLFGNPRISFDGTRLLGLLLLFIALYLIFKGGTKAVKQFAADLPKEANVSLRVYGHKGSNQEKDKELSCKSTEVVYNLKTFDEASFQQSLNQFQPTGWTPLAASMQAAKADLEKVSGENTKNILYVVSDGIETCGGDPVAVAKDLHESNIQAEVNIIGFDVDNEGQQQLKAAADAGGGAFRLVNTTQELETGFDDIWAKMGYQNSWNWWAVGNRADVVWATVDMKRDLRNLWFDRSDKINHMSERMSKAGAVLMEQKKFKGEDQWDAQMEYNELYRNRSEKIREYLDEKASKVSDELEKQNDELNKQINDTYDANQIQ